MSRYYCKKYKGFVTQKKAFCWCLLRGGCPHLTRWSRRMKRRYPYRWAVDCNGCNKSSWSARRKPQPQRA